MIYEIKKLFSSVFVLICLGVVVVFMGLNVRNAAVNANNNKEYKRLLADLNAQGLSEEEIIELYSEKESEFHSIMDAENSQDILYGTEGEYGDNLFLDYMLYINAYNDADYIVNQFPKHRQNTVKDSLYNINDEELKASPNQDILALNRLAVEKYNRVLNLRIADPGDFDKMLYYFENTFWDYVMAAFAVMLTVRMFTMDLSCKAYKMVYSSYNGKEKLFLKQYLSCIAVICCLVLLYAACQLICGSLCFGVQDYSIPIQTVSAYEFCPYVISIGGFFAIQTLVKLLFYIMVVSAAALFAVLSRKALPSVAGSLILAIAPIAVSQYFYRMVTNGVGLSYASAEYRAFSLMRCIVPQFVLNSKTYFTGFDYFSVFGICISRFASVLVITALIVIVCFAVSYRSFGRRMR